MLLLLIESVLIQFQEWSYISTGCTAVEWHPLFQTHQSDITIFDFLSVRRVANSVVLSEPHITKSGCWWFSERSLETLFSIWYLKNVFNELSRIAQSYLTRIGNPWVNESGQWAFSCTFYHFYFYEFSCTWQSWMSAAVGGQLLRTKVQQNPIAAQPQFIINQVNSL